MTTRVQVRTLALPAEHGGWGFTLEPVALGMLVAPSAAGLLLGLFALFAFLAHRPMRLVLVDLRRRRSVPRTRVAATVGTVYLGCGAAALAGAFMTADHAFWWPLAASSPLLVVQGRYETKSRTRELGRQLAGPIAAGSVAAAIGLADGWPALDSAGLWAVLAVRIVLSVMLVRAQIARAHGRPYSSRAVGWPHAAGAATALAAAGWGLIPWLGAAALVSLSPWAAFVLGRPPARAIVVGLSQMVVGATVVLATAAGHWSGW